MRPADAGTGACRRPRAGAGGVALALLAACSGAAPTAGSGEAPATAPSVARPPGGAEPVAGDGEATAVPALRRVLVVSGMREQAEDGTVRAGLYPLFAYETSKAVSAPEGSGYTLELLNGRGEVVRSVDFAADATLPAGPDGEPAIEMWAVFVADPPDYRGVRVWRGKENVAELEASNSAPEVEVTAPAAGQTHGGETVQMSWSASDADGDVLSYVVYYSTDAGVSWRLLEPYLAQPRLVWPRSALAGTDRARIRVIATDGVLSASAESAVFSVANHPPRVRILNPRQGRTYGGYATVILDAEAYDNEDGRLDSSKIVWRSSIDGAIATGRSATVTTGDLTTGTHTITATATDSDNTAGSASVTVSVRATNDAPAAADDVLRAAAGRSVDLAVLANDADTEGDIFTHTLAVRVPAALGEAGRGGRSGTVGYRSTSGGYDVFEYVVCDQHRQCDTAEAVVAVEAAQ